MTSKKFHKKLKEIIPPTWEIRIRNNGHLALVAPCGKKVFCACTASDHRAIKNIERDVKKVLREIEAKERGN